jgi:hypothetical protein
MSSGVEKDIRFGRDEDSFAKFKNGHKTELHRRNEKTWRPPDFIDAISE